MKKLQDNRGETLVEVLASILIASLSVALLFGCVMASSNLNRAAKELDEEHYEVLGAAEGRTGQAVSGTADITNQVNSQSLNINIYGGAGMYSYSYEKGTGP